MEVHVEPLDPVERRLAERGVAHPDGDAVVRLRPTRQQHAR
jgi:hypothetical protein